MRSNETVVRWILIGFLVILIISSVALFFYGVSSLEPQPVSENQKDTAPVEKSDVIKKSKLTTGNVRPPSLSSEYVQADKATSGSVSSGGWIMVAFVALSLTTLISIVTTFYLYRWRRIILSQPHSEVVVPEQFGEWINGINTHITNLTDKLANGVNSVTQQSRDTNENVSNLAETFMSLQGGLDERDEEIRRLKRGYDAEIFRKFVTRFIRVDQIVEDLQGGEGADANDLEHIRRLLEDAFAECGVESFQPDAGADYRKTDGVADNPKSVQAENPEDAFKIIEVLESGYQIRTFEGSEVIIPAKVKIYSG